MDRALYVARLYGSANMKFLLSQTKLRKIRATERDLAILEFFLLLFDEEMLTKP